jgi:hypothetical protein
MLAYCFDAPDDDEEAAAPTDLLNGALALREVNWLAVAQVLAAVVTAYVTDEEERTGLIRELLEPESTTGGEAVGEG